MRPIKFRFWDINKKEWVKLPVLSKFGDGEISVSIIKGEANELPDRVIWSQFTGLLDAKGKEIYEGDVVSIGEQRKYVVEYLEGNAKYSLRAEDGTRFDISRNRDCEIIGNVWETPTPEEKKN